jgi:replication-associated recombination protein RarA
VNGILQDIADPARGLSQGQSKLLAAAPQNAAETSREPVPLHLRNAATPLMKHLGYGREYRYVHEDAGAKDEMSCLPEKLRGKIYYEDDGTAEDTEKT